MSTIQKTKEMLTPDQLDKILEFAIADKRHQKKTDWTLYLLAIASNQNPNTIKRTKKILEQKLKLP